MDLSSLLCDLLMRKATPTQSPTFDTIVYTIW